MKIIASKRDEVLQRKAEFEADYAPKKARYDQQYADYKQSYRAVSQGVEDAIRQQLGDLADNLTIEVQEGFSWGPQSLGCVEVKIQNSNWGGPRREDNASLSWSWNAKLDLELQEVKKESSSWSGLEVTTVEQVQDLKKCVAQLEAINNIDWQTVLNVAYPDVRSFVTEKNPDYNKPNFDSELFKADVEDSIGQRVLLLSQTGEGRNYRGQVYWGIVRDSGSQFTIFELPGYAVQQIQQSGSYNDITSVAELVEKYGDYTFRMKKDAFLSNLKRPLEMVEY
jgi:hypothetical protein